MVLTDEGESWGSLGERVGVPRVMRMRSAPRFNGGGMEVPGAEGRGTVVIGTGRRLDGGPPAAERSGFPGMIKVSGDMGAGPRLRSPLRHPHLSTVPLGLLLHVHRPQRLLPRP